MSGDNLIDGRAIAEQIHGETVRRIEGLTARGIQPGLAFVRVGDDPASQVYVGMKERTGARLGIWSATHVLPQRTAQPELLALIADLNADPRVHGILVQAPLPAAMGKRAAERVFDAIDPDKDVDGFHPRNVGLLVQNRSVLAPCTPSGVIELLTREAITIAGKHAVVIGRSEIVGKPMALLLLHKDATVTVCHSRTPDLPAETRRADILISAIGRPGTITADMVKPGAAVVDVGTTPLNVRAKVIELFGQGSKRLESFDARGTTVVGDVHPGVAAVAGALSPVPGGVGPLTIAMLLKNTLAAAEARSGGRS